MFCTILNWGWLPGITTEHVCSQICNISHYIKVGINILHICIFHLQFSFCTILNWSRASRCTYRSCVQSISQYFTSWEYSVFIFVFEFLICSFYFARYWSGARPPGVQTMCPINFAARSNRSLLLQFVFCILVFYILHFICSLYFLMSFAVMVNYFSITLILLQLIMTCAATVLVDYFRSRCQRNIA